MIRRALAALATSLALLTTGTDAQSVRAVPRPPVPPPGAPAEGSLAPDGYAPSPQWLGQTRAPRPAKTSAYTVETVAQGIRAAFSFNFLSDGRIILGERSGHIEIVGKDGKLSEVGGLSPNLFVRGQ